MQNQGNLDEEEFRGKSGNSILDLLSLALPSTYLDNGGLEQGMKV